MILLVGASRASAICRTIASASSTDWSARDPFVEALAVDEFEHEELHTVVFVEAVDRTDVRMIERSEDLRFALEAGKALWIVREGVRQNLQRHLATEFGVFRAIDLAHTAFADRRGDVVDAETRAGNEGQLRREYTGRTGAGTGLLLVYADLSTDAGLAASHLIGAPDSLRVRMSRGASSRSIITITSRYAASQFFRQLSTITMLVGGELDGLSSFNIRKRCPSRETS